MWCRGKGHTLGHDDGHNDHLMGSLDSHLEITIEVETHEPRYIHWKDDLHYLLHILRDVKGVGRDHRGVDGMNRGWVVLVV